MISCQCSTGVNPLAENSYVESLCIEIGISLCRYLPRPAGPAIAAPSFVPKRLFASAGRQIIIFHVLRANATDRTRAGEFWMLHVMDKANFRSFAHCADLRRLAQILKVNAGPTLMRHSGLRPFSVSCVVSHTKVSTQRCGTRTKRTPAAPAGYPSKFRQHRSARTYCPRRWFLRRPRALRVEIACSVLGYGVMKKKPQSGRWSWG